MRQNGYVIRQNVHRARESGLRILDPSMDYSIATVSDDFQMGAWIISDLQILKDLNTINIHGNKNEEGITCVEYDTNSRIVVLGGAGNGKLYCSVFMSSKLGILFVWNDSLNTLFCVSIDAKYILTLIIRQRNTNHGKVSNIQTTTVSTIFTWALTRTINASLQIIMKKFNVSTTNQSVAAVADDISSIPQRGCAIASVMQNFTQVIQEPLTFVVIIEVG